MDEQNSNSDGARPILFVMVRKIKILLWAAAMLLGVAPAVSAGPVLTGPVVDPAELLAPEAEGKIRDAALSFRNATGRWLVLIVLPETGSVDVTALQETVAAPREPTGTRTPIGIVFVMTPGDTAGTLLVVDPDWRRVARHEWIPMFPRRLAQKYRDEPFERRVVLSARYLAKVFPDKIAFLLKPPDRIGEESLAFAEFFMMAIKWFIYFIILFTFFRTIWPARLSDDDDDEFSNELRRLAKERRIW